MNRILAATFLALIASGCAEIAQNAGLSDVQEIVVSRVGSHVEWEQDPTGSERRSEEVAKLLGEELNCTRVVQIALLNNPTLQAKFESLGIAQAELLESVQLRNPVLDAQLHFQGGGIGAGTSLSLLEDIASLFTRSMRKKASESGFEATKFALADEILQFASSVKSACLVSQASAKIAALKHSSFEAITAGSELSSRLSEAGNLSDRESAADKLMHLQAKLEIMRTDLQLKEERENLALLLGLPDSGSIVGISTDLPEPVADNFDLNELQAIAATERLDLQAAKYRIEALGQRLGISETFKLLPELSAGVNVEGQDTGRTFVGPAFQLQLPLFNSGNARIRSDASMLRKEQKEYVALYGKVSTEVRNSLGRVLLASESVKVFKDEIIPTSEAALSEAQNQYNSMLIGAFELLKVKREEIEAKVGYYSAISDYWKAYAELERSVGGALPGAKK